MGRGRKLTIAALMAATAVLVVVIAAGCGSSATTSTSSPTGSASSKQLSIAFFGAAKANSFAGAQFAGIESYASKHNATVMFFDGNFSAPTQIAQIQDATASGKYQVFIVSANDSTALVPAVTAAISKGITVVAEFTMIGATPTTYDTAQPQVPGMYFVGDVPTDNGKALAQLALEAAKTAGMSHPIIAYLQGMPSLPLDSARTKAAVATLQAGGATVISSYVGGYTQAQGRSVGQDLFTAHPDVNVVIGSAQAIEGLETVIPAALKGKVQLVGNGGSTQSVVGVQQGRWYACYCSPTPLEGAMAAQVGLGAARGQTEPKSVTQVQLAKQNGFNVMGTKAALGNYKSTYSD
jgi:ribose transport system substrate-binding protein